MRLFVVRRFFLKGCACFSFAFVWSACTHTVDMTREKAGFIVTNLGPSVNTNADEVAPILSPGGSYLLFTSNRPWGAGKSKSDRLFRTTASEEGWSVPEYVALDGGDARQGAMSVEDSQRRAAFARCFDPQGVGDCDIFFLVRSAAGSTELSHPGFPFNNPEWDSHPALTRDGNTIVFASERDGGYGNSDLWVAQRMPDGSWGTPRNLGNTVNTRGEEKSPFLRGDGDTLYFASDGHGGYGGLDIFRSVRVNGVWGKPVNLGPPLNSDEDDAFLSGNEAGDTLFFCSRRGGGFGGFDLYSAVRRKPPPSPIVERTSRPLTVRYTVKNAFTLDPIPAVVTYIPEGGEEIRLQAGNDGRAETTVECGRAYTVTGAYPGFAAEVDSFFYPAGLEGVRDRTLLLTPVIEKTRKLYSFVVEFDFDLFNIRPEERKNLDSVARLLLQYPNSTVVVSGHTDSVGTEAYNIRLGYNRAREVSRYVERYLLSRVASLRNPIEIRTYGESEPIAPNATAEGRQRNRRVEIAIIRNE
ncbi:MAG: OmpA family protein [Bacteroidota bacterium]|nr:OmpA family protein [Bacteroidota bacterium]